jgi:uncharacterized protein (TIGR00369 family)
MRSQAELPFGDQCHPACIVCRPRAVGGLGLEFHPQADGSVEAEFPGGDAYQGYTGILHGGVIAMLLDAAMTNCLFAQDRRGVTADLAVRFRHPVASAQPVRLRAWVERSVPPLYLLRAELWQADQLRATATGKFMDTSGGIIFGRKGHQSPATPGPADPRKEVSAPAADAEAPWPAGSTTSSSEGVHCGKQSRAVL